MRLKTLLVGLLPVLLIQCSYSQSQQTKTGDIKMDTSKKISAWSKTDTSKVQLNDEELKKKLSPEVYYVARQKGTERPWTSKFESFKEIGTYYCAVCGNPLFKSDTKFESGCGWPSFYEPISKGSIIYLPDNTYGMQRTEVECGRCKSHLGHVFEDGPPPTGLRYCINGVVLDFEKAQAAEKKYNDTNKDNEKKN
ncbi:MAG: peptide-methionine (R)-S-oxide reductase MsrB [Sphingobacteriales bacterium]|nr:peptide-methionine (R)-S-oxide reductase MsrB [Sphingobacteriales bacterium]